MAMIRRLYPFFLLCLLLIAAGCTRQIRVSPPPSPEPPESELTQTGYTIQVGAFRNYKNAARLARHLNKFNLNAYYFEHRSGLYKVRFGDFTLKSTAQKRAQRILDTGVIKEFYIVSPESYALKKEPELGPAYIRNEIISRAESYLGIPYQWGGSSLEEGFDCSGLTMAVYQLIGLNLPHSAEEQFRTGTPVKKERLQKGDLIFFRTSGSQRISHVGIFTGNGRFIHASGRNKKIRIDSLSSTYFKKHYAGARAYLQHP